MVRYYGFLSNRKRGRLLPLVYLALEKTSMKKAEPLTYGKQYKGLTGKVMTRTSVFCAEEEWSLQVF